MRVHMLFVSKRSEEENDFDKPDPLPDDPADASNQEITNIRNCIFKLLRNQDDDEPYTFRELRNKVRETIYRVCHHVAIFN